MHRPIESKPDSAQTSGIEVVLVTAPGCHFCDDARSLLEEFGRSSRLVVREVELSSDEGSEIARHFRVPFPPVVLVNGAYVGHGRISGRKLAKVLDGASSAEIGR